MSLWWFLFQKVRRSCRQLSRVSVVLTDVSQSRRLVCTHTPPPPPHIHTDVSQPKHLVCNVTIHGTKHAHLLTPGWQFSILSLNKYGLDKNYPLSLINIIMQKTKHLSTAHDSVQASEVVTTRGTFAAPDSTQGAPDSTQGATDSTQTSVPDAHISYYVSKSVFKPHIFDKFVLEFLE
jgi:hypothetical protein